VPFRSLLTSGVDRFTRWLRFVAIRLVVVSSQLSVLSAFTDN
jgi:hypothetical protein